MADNETRRLFDSDSIVMEDDPVNLLLRPKVREDFVATWGVLQDIANPSRGLSRLPFNPTLNYVAGSLGAMLQDNVVNFLAFCSPAQRTAIKAKTFADDLTAVFAFALLTAAGRPLLLPGGGYKISSAVLSVAGQTIIGHGWPNTIVRSSDAGQNLFTVTADNVTLQGFQLQGAATDETNSTFAIFTTAATPARRLRVVDMMFSGADVARGFNNAVKFDSGCDNGLVVGCFVERLQGSTSGHGYGVLMGNVSAARVLNNSFIQASGGRHAVYLSGGANKCLVEHNVVQGYGSDQITQFSDGAQPPCSDNVIARNVLTAGAAINTFNSGGIGIFGHARRTKVLYNTILGSLGCGIKIDGTNFSDLLGTELVGNTIEGAAFFGIDLLAAVGGLLSQNTVVDSGQSTPETIANIRFKAAGGVATRGWNVTGNVIPASSVSRAGIFTDSTAPLPTALNFSGNQVGAGTVARYEFGVGAEFAVDGRLRYSYVWNPPELASGASNFGPWSTPGAAVGDVVTVTHSASSDGCALYGYVRPAGFTNVTVINASGALKNIDEGTLNIDVWKRG